MPTARTRPNGNGSTAVATREPDQTNLPAERQQHPIIVALEERMSEIVELLPPGMDGKRFKGVVWQALLKNRDLFECSFVSIFTAVREAAEAGLEPTGTLGRAWLLPYNVNVGGRDNPRWEKRAQLIIGYRGFAELAWRADRVLFTVETVRDGDAFSYQRGTEPYLHHTPDLDDAEREADDSNITYVYSIARFPDGRVDFEVMSWSAVTRIRDRARKKNPVWDTDAGEMGKKTVLRRHVKRLPLSAQVQRFLAEDEAVDFETPVERVAAPARVEAARSRIAERTAALRGEQPAQDADDDPPEALDDGPPPEKELEVDDIPFEQGAGAMTGGADHAGGVSAAAPASVACSHPQGRYISANAGLTCGDCGELIAARSSAPPERVHKAKSPREALMARIHVGRSHEEARTLAAVVLGLNATEEWSMADLVEDELQAVVDAIRDEDQRRGSRQARHREPAAAGRRRS